MGHLEKIKRSVLELAAYVSQTKPRYVLSEYGRGFFAGFRTVLENLQYCELKKYRLIPDWSCSPYADKNHGGNAWDYFFEPINDCKLEDLKNKHWLAFKIDWVKSQHKMLPIEIHGKLLTLRETYNHYIRTAIRLKPNVSNKVNDFYETKMKGHVVLGVHIRRTDKSREAYLRDNTMQPLSDEEFAINIDRYIHKNKNCKLFIATDSEKSFEYIQSRYKQRVIHWNSARSPDETSIHGGGYDKGLMTVSNFKKGEDALMDCLLLSRCDFLIRSQSSLSNVSLCWNLNLKQLDLNWLYRQCKNDDFIENTLL